MSEKIRKIYLYLFSLVGLVLMVMGGVRLVNLGLKAFIFTEAEMYYRYPAPKPIVEGDEQRQVPTEEEIEEYRKKERASSRQRDAAESLAFIIVGTPLYLYHWKTLKKERE